VLADFGEEWQRRLRNARVLVVGLGGLGSPVALYLAAAGVGTLGLVDADRVSLSNLQRQIVHGMHGLGCAKPESARERLSDLNPLIRLEPIIRRFAPPDAAAIVRDFDLVVDGTDNLETRIAINDGCLDNGIPYVYGAVSQYEGQTGVLCLDGGPCYSCLFPTMPAPGAIPSAEETGILGVVPGVIGTLQATAALRWIAGFSETPLGRLLIYDARRMDFTTVEISRDPRCPACAGRPSGGRPSR